MIQKKICMLGSFAVGKTSLINRFVRSIFSEKYLTTVGVKIDRKELVVHDRQVNLVLWDIHGDDEYQRVRLSYLRGTGGYFLVADGTRKSTLDHALALHEEARGVLEEVPFLLVLNKADLTDEWEVEEATLAEFEARGWIVLKTSAKSGENVDRIFDELARLMLPNGD